jgi:hypothetical protein
MTTGTFNFLDSGASPAGMSDSNLNAAPFHLPSQSSSDLATSASVYLPHTVANHDDLQTFPTGTGISIPNPSPGLNTSSLAQTAFSDTSLGKLNTTRYFKD